jgi:hypothetical protein
MVFIDSLIGPEASGAILPAHSVTS